MKGWGTQLRPTRLGVAFLGLVLLTLVGCINYGLNLGYGLTFLLGGVWIITAAQALRAVKFVNAGVLPPAQARAGQPVTYAVQVQALGQAVNMRVQGRAVQAGQAVRVTTSGFVPTASLSSLSLTVAVAQRGPLHLQSLRLEAVDSFGLWHAALPLPDAPEVLVHPVPEPGAPPAPTLTVSGAGDSGKRTPGNEEFAGVRAYQSGDSPRLISWRHVARTGTLLTREFDAPAGQGLNLDWASTAPAGGTEARLSRLSAWAEQARHSGQPFSLTLPDFRLGVGSGEAHARAALDALARQQPLPAIQTKAAAQPGFLSRPAWLQASAAPQTLCAPAVQYTLLALGLALLPGLTVWPAWVSALMLLVLAYRFVQARPERKLPLPSSLILLLGAVLVGAGLNASYGTLLGQQAGTAVLAALIVLKAAETRTVRDAKLLPILGLFLLVTHFFHSQGPLTALHVLVGSALLLSALARWVNPDTWTLPLGSRDALRQAAKLLLLAAPVAALLFAFFPRPDGPLWRIPFQGGAQTGLSDELNAGSFSNLAKDNSVAFRADFQGGVLPPPAERYWRGPVYELYDGVKWTQGTRFITRFTPPSLETIPSRPAYAYTLTLEPNGQHWLLALENVTQVPQDTVITSGFQAATPRAVSTRTRFNLHSQAALTGRNEDTTRLQLNLALPSGESPRASALARTWLNLPPQERINKASEFLARGGFTYTLSPPTLPEHNRVDAFLYGSKQGFCEHYASAFAFLMRAAGLPARVIGGYQGGEVNPDGGYLIVRQQDAHAWTEVWLRGQGWVRIDPTALIAPARVNTNLSTALRSPTANSSAPRSAWHAALLRVDAFQAGWNDWVAGYGGEQQRGVLGRLGLGNVGSAPYLLGLAALVILGFLPALLLVRRADRPRDPALAALHDLQERLKLPREAGETASTYAERAAQAYPSQANLLHDIAQLYNSLRYGKPGGPELKLLQEKIRSVRRDRNK